MDDGRLPHDSKLLIPNDAIIILEKEVMRHREDVALNRAAHFRRHGEIKKMIKLLNYFTYGSLWVLVAIWFIDTQSKPFSISESQYYIEFSNYFPIISLLSIIVALLSTVIQYFGDLNESARSQWMAAQRYQRIFRQLVNWRTDCQCEADIPRYTVFLQGLRDEITKANNESPDLTKADWKHAKKAKDDDSSRYDVDEN